MSARTMRRPDEQRPRAGAPLVATITRPAPRRRKPTAPAHNLQLAGAGGSSPHPGALLLTSAGPDEGKSTVVPQDHTKDQHDAMSRRSAR